MKMSNKQLNLTEFFDFQFYNIHSKSFPELIALP